jgi:hypothetical protein
MARAGRELFFVMQYTKQKSQSQAEVGKSVGKSSTIFRKAVLPHMLSLYFSSGRRFWVGQSGENRRVMALPGRGGAEDILAIDPPKPSA